MIDHIESIIKKITHGVYVVSVKDEDEENAFTAAWVMQVSFDPLLLCFSINPDHHSWKILNNNLHCVINVLSQEQMAIAEHFGRSGIKDKMAGFEWSSSSTGLPVLNQALAYFDCSVSHFADGGDHQLAICDINDAALLRPGTPMLYAETGNMDGNAEIYRHLK